MELSGRERAAVPRGMQRSRDGNAAVNPVRREGVAVAVAVRPCVPAVTGPGQEQGPPAWGARRERRVGPNRAAGVQVPAPAREPGGHDGDVLKDGAGRGARSDAGVNELCHGVSLPPVTVSSRGNRLTPDLL